MERYNRGEPVRSAAVVVFAALPSSSARTRARGIAREREDEGDDEGDDEDEEQPPKPRAPAAQRPKANGVKHTHPRKDFFNFGSSLTVNGAWCSIS